MDEQQILNEPYRFEWDGRELRLGLLTQGFKARFTADCKVSALREFTEYLELKYPGDLTDAQKLDRAMDEKDFREAMTSGRYKWGGDLSENWRRLTLDGQKTFMRHLLEEGGTPLDGEELGEMYSEMQKTLIPLQNLIMWDSERPKARRRRQQAAATTVNGALSKMKTSMPPSCENPTAEPSMS